MVRMEWEGGSFATIFCNVFSLCLATPLVLLPIYVIVFYGCKLHRLDDPLFARKYGALYEGLKLEMKENTRAYGLFDPAFFILRRIFFVFAAIWMDNFLWGQLAIQFACSVTLVIYFLQVWPFEDPMITKLEVMNEVTTVLLLYHMFIFTDWVSDATTRY